MPALASPADKGARSTGVPIPGFDRTDSMSDLVGASYTLNDHTSLAMRMRRSCRWVADACPGSRTPRTWMIATHTIYNFQEKGDRGMRWFHSSRVEAGLSLSTPMCGCVPVPADTSDSTADYTFLP
ncbi:MAG: hypothetical protein IPM33_13655 [Phycisphaerales bacterium]|nr:hypothetical protein [Phycisphaerales bacterium]